MIFLFYVGSRCDIRLCPGSVTSVVLIGGGVYCCEFVLFCNGVWFCDDVCCVSNVVCFLGLEVFLRIVS